MTASGASAAPIITVAGTCDTLANSTFTITNIGTAMTVNYTWELYQNSVFLTSGPFLLTAAGTAGDHQVLTINGLFGVIEVRVKDQNGAQLANASATCVERPRVTINKAAGQADPASALPIMFAAVFSRAVTGFTASDLVITGMANTPIVTLTDSGDHRNFSIAIDGVRDLETVRVTIPQDAAQAVNDGLGNFASTSNDNTVVYQAPPVITVAGTCDASANSQFAITNIGGAMSVNYTWELYQNSVFLTSGPFLLTAAGTPGATQVLTINGLYGALAVRIKSNTGVEVANATATCQPLSVTINQAAAQTDPASTSPINFDVVFSAPVNGFINTDVVISGMAAAPGVTVTDSGDHRHFTVAVTGAASGETIRASIPASVATDRSTSSFNTASTSTDNSVTFDTSRAVTAIVVDAVNPQIVTAALYGSGIWRSTNGGNAWVAATTQPGNLWLTALLVDPANGTRYYTASRGGGVYKSANAGTTWAACGSTGLGSLRINSMAMNATGTLVVGTEAGVFKSNDCGNWSIANSGLPVATTMPVTALLPDPLAANTLYAGVDGAGIYRTVTGGTAWTAVAAQPANLRVTALAIKPAAVATLYAATMGGGVFVSADSGTSWSACAALPGSANTLSLSIDALGTLVAGTESGVALSGDGCASWSSITAGWTGSGPQATGQGPLKFTAVAQAQEAARTLHAGNRSGTVQHTDLPPVLAAAAVSGTTQTTTTLTATSRETGKGEWIVVARNAQAPTFAQVKAAVSYAGVTIVASGSGAMTQGVATNFPVTGLTADTAYDLYVVVEDVLTTLGFAPLKVQFATPPNTYNITVTVSPLAGGTASCTPNPVNQGSSATCTAVANPAYLFAGWSGSCIGSTCMLSNVTAAQSVNARFVPTLNVDGSSTATLYHGPTDGQIIVRYMQGLRNGALTANLAVSGAAVTDPVAIATYLASLDTLLDIDGNGSIDAATDGLLIVRYMLGLRGNALIADALGPAPRARSTAADIEAWLAGLMP
ncbi:MAG TPA: hypothetical protein PLJ16_05135 [Casimicrobium huifangae]|nr:hypothetical protein [Casimicrobium huifangae]